MKRTWSLDDKLADVVAEAIQDGPQMITSHGFEVAIVLPHAERATRRESLGSLAQFFLQSPLVGSGLDLRRDRRQT